MKRQYEKETLEWRKAFTARLNAVMAEKNITRGQLAFLSGLNPNEIGNYRCGRYLPSSYNLMLICDALEVEADWLLGLMD